MSEPFDSSNKYNVTVRGSRIIVSDAPMGAVSFDDALNFAAWLVVTVGNYKRWQKMLRAVEKTTPPASPSE